jgi:aspartyl/asparaginyl-tRNA synthetase
MWLDYPCPVCDITTNVRFIALFVCRHCCSYLSEVVFAKSPLIVTDYPKDIKAFYMRLNDDNQTVAAMDLLVPK